MSEDNVVDKLQEAAGDICYYSVKAQTLVGLQTALAALAAKDKEIEGLRAETERLRLENEKLRADY